MAPASTPRQHTVGDFLGYGRRHHIDYRFLTGEREERAGDSRRPVARGRVDEFGPARGARLTASDLEILTPYASRSRGSTALLLVAVLEGRIRLGLDDDLRWLGAGEAFTTRLDGDLPLQAHQGDGQRLRTLSLALDAEAMVCWVGSTASAGAPHPWRLGPVLLATLEQAFSSPLQGQARCLLHQGLALQLLAHGLAGHTGPGAVDSARRRLEAVRRRLDETPAQAHRLDDLARQAAMSPSTLVRRFRAAYGLPPFDYLRRRRLALARELLLTGHSVQQAAQLCGYGHASNFITAFRRAYGVSPGSLG